MLRASCAPVRPELPRSPILTLSLAGVNPLLFLLLLLLLVVSKYVALQQVPISKSGSNMASRVVVIAVAVAFSIKFEATIVVVVVVVVVVKRVAIVVLFFVVFELE